MPLTFGQLKSDLRKQLWPAGEARNLVIPHDQFFLEALIDCQSFVECLQQDNTSLIPHCATFYNCGLTVFEAPRGAIKSVEVMDKEHALPSGDVTASKTGSIITSSEDFFDASMVGAQIQFADMQTFTIAVYIDPTHVGVVEPGTSTGGCPISLGTNARINCAGNLELLDPDDDLWHEVTLAGDEGQVQVTINQTGVP